jgi:hypothetical protein
VWHRLWNAEYLETGDAVLAVEVADRGGRNDLLEVHLLVPCNDGRLEGRVMSVRQINDLLAGYASEAVRLREFAAQTAELCNERTAVVERLQRQIHQARMLEQQGGIRLLLPVRTVDLVTLGDPCPRQVEVEHREVFISERELRAVAQQQLDRLYNASPPLGF